MMMTTEEKEEGGGGRGGGEAGDDDDDDDEEEEEKLYLGLVLLSIWAESGDSSLRHDFYPSAMHTNNIGVKSALQWIINNRCCAAAVRYQLVYILELQWPLVASRLQTKTWKMQCGNSGNIIVTKIG